MTSRGFNSKIPRPPTRVPARLMRSAELLHKRSKHMSASNTCNPSPKSPQHHAVDQLSFHSSIPSPLTTMHNVGTEPSLKSDDSAPPAAICLDSRNEGSPTRMENGDYVNPSNVERASGLTNSREETMGKDECENDSKLKSPPGQKITNSHQATRGQDESDDSQIKHAPRQSLDDGNNNHSISQFPDGTVASMPATGPQDIMRKDNNFNNSPVKVASGPSLASSRRANCRKNGNDMTQLGLQIKLKSFQESDSAAREDFNRVRANLLRIEQERTGRPPKPTKDVERLTKLLSRARGEALSLKRQLADAQRVSKEDVFKLKQEVAEYKRKLSLSSHDANIKKTADLRERRKLESELARYRNEAKALRKTIDDQKTRIEELEAKLQESIQSREKIEDFETASYLKEELNLIMLKENTLREENHLLKTLLKEAEDLSTSTQKSLEESKQREANLKEEIDGLRKTIADLEASKKVQEALQMTRKSDHETLDTYQTLTEINSQDLGPDNRNDIALRKKMNEDYGNSNLNCEASDGSEERRPQGEVFLKRSSLSHEDSGSSNGESETSANFEEYRKAKEQISLNQSCLEKVSSCTMEAPSDEDKIRSHSHSHNQLCLKKVSSCTMEAPSDEIQNPKQLGVEYIHEIKRLMQQRKRGRETEQQLNSKIADLKRQLDEQYEAENDNSNLTNSEVEEKKSLQNLHHVVDLAKNSLAQGSQVGPRSVSPDRSVDSTISCSISASTETASSNESSRKAKKPIDVAALRLRIRESSQRLVDANSRLKGLVQASDDYYQENMKIRKTCASVIKCFEAASQSPSDVKTCDEVISCSPDAVEVAQRRFAYV